MNKNTLEQAYSNYLKSRKHADDNRIQYSGNTLIKAIILLVIVMVASGNIAVFLGPIVFYGFVQAIRIATSRPNNLYGEREMAAAGIAEELKKDYGDYTMERSTKDALLHSHTSDNGWKFTRIEFENGGNPVCLYYSDASHPQEELFVISTLQTSHLSPKKDLPAYLHDHFGAAYYDLDSFRGKERFTLAYPLGDVLPEKPKEDSLEAWKEVCAEPAHQVRKLLDKALLPAETD